MKEKKIVLLIDAENTSAKYADGIMKHISGKGDIITAQIYGDFIDNSNTKKWNNKAIEYNLQRYQADTTKAGKNAADIMLVIDAMDLLYKENPADIFCIVTSDGDFTSLVERIRKEAITVIGMGKEDASPRLRRACSEYVELEGLKDISKLKSKVKSHEDEQNDAKDNDSSEKTKKKKKSGKNSESKDKVSRKKDSKEPLKNIKITLNQLVQQDESQGKQADLGGIKSRLQLKYPGFDEKNYGYKSIRELIDHETKFKVIQGENQAYVISDKKDANAGSNSDDDLKESVLENTSVLENVCAYILDSYPKKVIGVHEVGSLGRKLKGKFPDFDYKEYGYNKLSAFLTEIGMNVY